MQIATASGARVAEADPFAGSQIDDALTPAALHALIVRQKSSGCQAQQDSLKRPRLSAGNVVRMRRALALALGVLLAVGPLAAAAQSSADLRGLAVNWIRGRYASPLLCAIDGEPVRGLRRVLATPSRAHPTLPTGRLIFVEMDVANASRCFTEMGAKAPNLRGSLHFRLPGPARPDTAVRDLKAMLKRQKGITFDVVRGEVQRRPVGEDDAAWESMDFAGGQLRFLRVGKGSDVERLLKDFPSPRKLEMTLTSSDGRSLKLPLFLVELR